MSDEHPSARELLTNLRDAASPWLLDRTVALMVESPPGVLQHYGTGLLLAIADHVFLISAAHVLQKAASHQLWMHPGVTAPALVPLQGVTVETTEDLNVVDFGFVHLPEELAQELATTKRFIRLSEIDLEPEPAHGMYAAFGFPGEINASKSTGGAVIEKPFYYGTKLHDWTSGKPKLTTFDPKLNVALQYAWTNSSDHTGNIAVPPHPRGMSGCGLWRLSRYAAMRRTWTPDDVRLVGIQHAHVEKKTRKKNGRGRSGPKEAEVNNQRYGVLVGVRMSHVVRIIYRQFADLRASIDLHWPTQSAIMVTRDVE